MDESLLDLSVVCLVCLRVEQDYCCIFTYDQDTPEMQIVDKIIACSSLVLPQEILQRVPNKICKNCLSELSTTWRFRKKCEAANQVFKTLQCHALQVRKEVKNVALGEHKLKIPTGLNVRRIHLTLKLPSKADPFRLHEEPNLADQYVKLEDDVILSPSTSAKLETDYDIDQQSLVQTSSSAPSPSARTEIFGEDKVAIDAAMLDNSDATTKEDNTCGPQIEYVYDAIEYFDDSKDDLPIAMPKSKVTSRQKIDTFHKPQVTLPKDFTQTIKLERFETSSAAQVLNVRKLSADSKGIARRKPMPNVLATQQTKHAAAAKVQRKGAKGKGRPSKICNVCGNTYKYQHALDAHMRRHNNERPYPCEVCNKAFVSNVELRRHMRVHTGQKPYGCKFCDRRFSDFGSSKKHERIHTGERPYVCDVCNKGFAYAHVLTVHKRTHTGEKQFPCVHCDKGFTKKAYLLAHIERHKRTKHLPNIVKDQELNSTDFGLHGVTVDSDILLRSKNGNYDMDVDDDEDIIDDDDNDTDVALNTVVFDDDKVLEECIVTSEFMADSDTLPDESGVVNDPDDINNDTITVVMSPNEIGAVGEDVVHPSPYPVVLSAHYLEDSNQSDDAKYILQ